jgi:hypothetical protein
MLELAYRTLIAQKQHTFLIRNEVFQNPDTLRQCGSYWKPAVERAERGTVALIRRYFSE